MKSITSGAWLGVVGGGQLGQMFTHAAQKIGYKVCVFNPERNCPAGLIAEEVIAADFTDKNAINQFAEKVQVATLEFENVPVETVLALESKIPFFPGSKALTIAQDRIKEKTFFEEIGAPTTVFFPIRNLAELKIASDQGEFPAVLKTARFGYDGKGQVKVNNSTELTAAWESLQKKDCILEAWVEFEKEISIISARSSSGEVKHFRAFENSHANHILDLTFSPAEISQETEAKAVALSELLLVGLNYVGVLCIELFVRSDQSLLINEIAPRPHNSGHLTIDAVSTSQFEQQVRAICNLQLGSTELLKPSAMINLLGDLWSSAAPDFNLLSKIENTYLHLYGKTEPRVGRKMGHITAIGTTVSEAVKKVVAARKSLQ
ncbi:MAG: 5-(carboxyamino)imidazole ribonucleotide synthase [Bdellovibrionota bacterium]